ncbi:hypothetical protein PR202_gb00010 [Eleusine coracana subsp. coracana]|uniref:Uncharacterized protein n=1 Tax=Eleusine coracana subsp. coracana TaxID=191504 RepID=A0AAV5DQW0_ELECO|nr:hypothetical protein PR202_gb00010 [Eleusine coracana subsp. coracana]
MALDLPAWAIKAVDKYRQNFLWHGRKEANRGHYLIAWPKVTRPKELGGLGILDLKNLGRALCVRWCWLIRTEPEKAFPMQESDDVQALLSMAVTTEIGNGGNTLFWQDRWILGQRMEDLFPLIHSMIPRRKRNKRTVQEALTAVTWVHDIHGVASIPVIMEFIHLCDILVDITVQPEVPDLADQANGEIRQGPNSIIILGSWTLWRHRNDCVFNNVSPSIATALILAGDERFLWDMAGAKALAALPVHGGTAMVEVV